MSSDIVLSNTRSHGHPIIGVLASFPVACFVCALATDLAYVGTANIMWANFSAWLLAAGMAGGVLGALVGLVHLIRHRHEERAYSVWPLVIGSLFVLVIGAFDNLVHSRDAWTSVMPTGLILSVVLVVLTLLTAWLGARSRRTEFGQRF